MAENYEVKVYLKVAVTITFYMHVIAYKVHQLS